MASRTPARAAVLAAKVAGDSVPWERLETELGEADIVVTATGSVQPIVTRQQVTTAMQPRRDRPLFIMDIGLPRDVDPSAGDLEQVFLYNIDDLRTIVRENLTRRQSQVDHGERLVEEEVERFVAWLRSRAAIPTVVALRHRFESIRQSEINRVKSKLASTSSTSHERVEEIIEEVTHRIVEKLLLQPTEQLKAVTDEKLIAAYTEAVNHLFNLVEESDEIDTEKAFPPTRPLVAPPTAR